MAKEKTRENPVTHVDFEEGFSDQLPFSGDLFHHIFMSLFIFRLTLEMKKKTFEEVHRALRVGGQFHIIDF
ncbi:class I SAM-dependent methyltransferase [Planococcus lenghuensis]|uniref:class I SAM-dependent methyltransferase n=1 Tax=Planococcus lenghuensis TaxID=2213202 RepID=UPI000986D1C5